MRVWTGTAVSSRCRGSSWSGSSTRTTRTARIAHGDVVGARGYRGSRTDAHRPNSGAVLAPRRDLATRTRGESEQQSSADLGIVGNSGSFDINEFGQPVVRCRRSVLTAACFSRLFTLTSSATVAALLALSNPTDGYAMRGRRCSPVVWLMSQPMSPVTDISFTDNTDIYLLGEIRVHSISARPRSGYRCRPGRGTWASDSLGSHRWPDCDHSAEHVGAGGINRHAVTPRDQSPGSGIHNWPPAGENNWPPLKITRQRDLALRGNSCNHGVQAPADL